MKVQLLEVKSALELAVMTAPNVPEATMSNGCITMSIDIITKLLEEYNDTK